MQGGASLTELKLYVCLDLRIGKHISLAIHDKGITINDFSEKSKVGFIHRVSSLEVSAIKIVHPIHCDFKKTLVYNSTLDLRGKIHG